VGLFDYWSIRTFDVAIDNRSELVYGLAAPAPISISDEYLAYLDKPVANFGWRVYKKLLYGKEIRPSIPPSGENARAGGKIVVYQDKKSGTWDLWLWKGQEPSALVADPGDQINPSTDGFKVVWQDNRNGNWDIYALDLNNSQKTQITDNPADQASPDVENGVIVYQDQRSGSWDIYAYDMNTGKETAICTDEGDQTQPRIAAGKIVWTDNRSGDQDIYIYENYVP